MFFSSIYDKVALNTGNNVFLWIIWRFKMVLTFKKSVFFYLISALLFVFTGCSETNKKKSPDASKKEINVKSIIAHYRDQYILNLLPSLWF